MAVGTKRYQQYTWFGFVTLGLDTWVFGWNFTLDIPLWDSGKLKIFGKYIGIVEVQI